MKTKPDKYVEWIDQDTVRIVCNDKPTRTSLKQIGGKTHLLTQSKFTFRYTSPEHLAEVLGKLRDLAFCFVGGNGWPPAAVFEDLREKGLLAGKFLEVVWARGDKPIISEK